MNAVERFLAQAAAAPEALAVSDEEGTSTYAELRRQAFGVAERLAHAGVAKGDAVLVAAGRTREAVAAILGVALAGAVYVPLGPDEPAPRVSAIVEDSAAAVALADASAAGTLGSTDLRVLDLAAGPPGPAGGGAAPGIGPDDLAYVFFTSGSTGRPKGVEITHGSFAAFLAGARTWAGLGRDDVLACFHAFTFDISLWELWGPLTYGAHVVVVPRLAQIDAKLLLEIIASRRVTRLHQTPTALRQLGAAVARAGVPESLRSLFVGGERLDFRWLEPFAEAMAERGLEPWNLYGPTETTIAATGRPIRLDETRIEMPSLIGRALPHVEVGVFDEDGAPAREGELVISGPGVGRGYRGLAGDERFGCDALGRRVFRTGDLVRVDEGGELEFLGRSGGFVKVRGYRIEPDEVAAALESHPDVVEAAVCATDALGETDELAAAVVLRSGASATDGELRRHVGARLSAHTRPARIVVVDALPRLPSAKLDRNGVRDLVADLLRDDPRARRAAV
jgi:amino acid adenylation domain-containing protein